MKAGGMLSTREIVNPLRSMNVLKCNNNDASKCSI